MKAFPKSSHRNQHKLITCVNLEECFLDKIDVLKEKTIKANPEFYSFLTS